MKKLLKLMVIGLGFAALMFIVMGTDTSKRPGYYDDLGITVGQMMLEFIDSTDYDDSIAFYGITGLVATPTGNAVAKQLERRTMTIPIITTDAGIDTVWTQLFTVPAGQTITVTEMLLSAHTEGDEATDTLHCAVLYYQGTAKATLDTCVTSFCTDDDSTIVYKDTIYTMTLVDSVFTAGDIVSCWWMGPGGAMTEGQGAAITIEYLLDE